MDVEQRCNILRQELKGWEKQFTVQHDGRKAGRDDIKADAVISQKYKEYNKLRASLTTEVEAAPQTPSKRPASRKTSQDVEGTPKAQLRHLSTTPMKRKRDSGVDFEGEEDAAVADFSSPHGPAMIGPTPQRDGIVLGLFDLLPAGTPSRSRVVFAEVTPNDLQTPSRKVGKADSEASLESRMRRDKTPVSVGKRFLLDTFVTPKKRKLNEEGTPTSLFKGFSTPAFLRRSTALDIIDEDNEPTPRPAPWNRRGFGRSLSSVIQSMKQQEEDRLEAEEDRLDDEADIMREMEMEAEGIFVPKRAKIPAVLVEDSQAPMPLGPDRGIGSDDEDDEENAADGLDRNGKPRKVWKKRGMKRQTRRSILRPNFTKPKPEQPLQAQEDSDSETGVAETQQNSHDIPTGDEDSEDESEYASDASHTPKKRKTQDKKTKVAVVVPAKSKEKAAGPVKTAVRKIKATANANYRRLKIKSKGGNGGKGRFGRR